jgi:hypothetical protein
MLVYFIAIWYILWPFGIFCGHLVYFVAIWYILWPFGIFCGHLVQFMVIWYIFTRFGTSGNWRNLATLVESIIIIQHQFVDNGKRKQAVASHDLTVK